MTQTEHAELEARVRMIVKLEVDAAVERLRREFAERETMLIQALKGHIDGECDHLERPFAAENK